MKKRTIISIFTFLLVAAVVAGTLAAFSDGFKNWDVMTWFNNCTSGDEDKTTEVKSPALVTDGNGNALDSDKVYPLPKAVYFGASAPASVSEPQTASFSVNTIPYNTDFKQVDWSVAWANASSTWANGKAVTEYVTVKPHADGYTIAQVSCTAAFGERIVLTCTSRHNTDIAISATLEYMKRPTDITLQCGYSNNQGQTTVIDVEGEIVPFGTELEFAPNGSGVGTVDDTYMTTMSFGFTDSFSDYVAYTYSSPDWGFNYNFQEYWGTDYTTLCEIVPFLTIDENNIKDMGLMTPRNGDGLEEFPSIPDVLAYFIGAMKSFSPEETNTDMFRIKVDCEGKKTGVKTSKIFEFSIDSSTMIIDIDGLEFSGQDSFIF